MHKDATGRAITRGAYVAYVVTTGYRGGVKFGAVVKLKEVTTENAQVWDHATQNYVSKDVTDYSIQIVSVEKEKPWNGPEKWTLQGKKEGKFARAIHVENLDRLILLEPHQMDPEVKEILDRELTERGI